MNIVIENAVLKYIFKKNYEGLLLKSRNQSFGWAGCKKVILVEFVKEYSQVIENKFSCKSYKVKGIKVFIPYKLELEKVKELKVVEVVDSSSEKMFLDVEIK